MLLILAGLFLGSAVVFTSPEMFGRRFLKLVFHYCDYHQWPVWYATLLWITATGAVLSVALRFSRSRSVIEIATEQPPSKSHVPYVFYGTLAVLAIAVFFIWCPPGDLAKLFAKIFYYWFYVQFCYEPFVGLLEAGAVTWRLFVTPVAGLIVILLLLRLRRKGGTRRAP